MSEVSDILAIVPQLATKADLTDLRAALKSTMGRLIKWIVAAELVSAASAFIIGRFVH